MSQKRPASRLVASQSLRFLPGGKPLIVLFPSLLIHLLLLINLRFEAWPEMLIYPYLLKQGFLLYRDIINPYVPLFNLFLYGFFSLLELTVNNLKLLTWSIILFSDLLIYWVALKRYGQKAAILSLVFFVAFQPLLEGNGLWYDLALLPLLLLAFQFNSPSLLAVSFFIKQSVLWLFVLFINSWKKLGRWLIFLFLASCFLFFLNGTIHDYLFWAFKFPLSLFTGMPGHRDFGSVRLWLVALLPFLLPSVMAVARLVAKPRFRRQLADHTNTSTGTKLIRLGQSSLNSSKLKTEPTLWMFVSFLLIFPRFGLFHLQPALAFAALSVAQSARHIKLKKIFHRPLVILFLILYWLFLSLMWFRQVKFYWREPTRFFEPEIIAAAATLQSYTQPEQPLLFLNSPDQLMVISHRLPVKPWIATFPWYLELAGQQERLIAGAKNQSVQAVVFSPYQSKNQYTPGSYIPQKVNAYVKQTFSKAIYLSDNIQLLIK